MSLMKKTFLELVAFTLILSGVVLMCVSPAIATTPPTGPGPCEITPGGAL